MKKYKFSDPIDIMDEKNNNLFDEQFSTMIQECTSTSVCIKKGTKMRLIDIANECDASIQFVLDYAVFLFQQAFKENPAAVLAAKFEFNEYIEKTKIILKLNKKY